MYRGGKGVGLLCGEAVRRYSKAVSLLSVTTELWEAINEHDSNFTLGKKNRKMNQYSLGSIIEFCNLDTTQSLRGSVFVIPTCGYLFSRMTR
jgi:hypothetical protein